MRKRIIETNLLEREFLIIGGEIIGWYGQLVRKDVERMPLCGPVNNRCSVRLS